MNIHVIQLKKKSFFSKLLFSNELKNKNKPIWIIVYYIFNDLNCVKIKKRSLGKYAVRYKVVMRVVDIMCSKSLL